MSPLLVKICKDFATIWTTIDPIGNVAIFAGLTASLTCSGAFYSPRGRRRATARRRNEEESKRRFLILAGNAVPGEPVAHRGVFGRRGRAPFGEFLALFRQQFH